MENNNEVKDTNQSQLNAPKNKSGEKGSKAKEKAKNVAANGIKKLLKKNAGKSALMKALAPILIKVGLVLLILFIIIGIIMFLVTMPGMVMEKLKQLFEDIATAIAHFFGADSAEQIDNEDIYTVLDELETMGYDLKGYGFLTQYVDIDKDGNLKDDEDDGVLRDDDDKISKAESDYIRTYMVSDNYVYTLKNHNLATVSDKNNILENMAGSLGAGLYNAANFIAGPVFDLFGINDGVMQKWGKGLITIWYDNGTIGVKDKMVNDQTLWNMDTVKIDAKSKTLSIKKHSFLNNNNAIEYPLDGWTGRYGMPLELLLSIHLSTMMPDLAVEMATKFPTNIDIYLHDIEGEARTAFKQDEDEYIDYREINKKINNVYGDNGVSRIINWIDDKVGGLNEDELEKLDDVGFPPAPNCTCDEDGKYCENCKKSWRKMLDAMYDNDDPDFEAYETYIASVTNHWYRNVYFVIDEDTPDFVKYDYDYEALMKERWTLYETYSKDEDEKRAGEFKLYRVEKDGSYGELYEGTSEDAKKEGIKVSKKAKTLNSSNETSLKDLNWNNSNGVWTAYKEKKTELEGDYEPLYPDIANSEEEVEEKDEYKKYIFVKRTTTGNVMQKGDGQRSETNPQIKKMFLKNKYFRYDGTEKTAEIITEMRRKIVEEETGMDFSPEDTVDEIMLAIEELARGKDGVTYYKAIPKKYRDLTVDVTDDEGKTETHKVSDYIATVALSQDSLNAFSMLENTHTLDADFIYRDFKELVVELNYFTKEELTDEAPRLLQWIVPDIGSYEFPKRIIDKNENEFGTMIHSKSDIDTVNLNELAKLKENVEEQEPEEGGLDSSSGNTNQNESGSTSNVGITVGAVLNNNTENEVEPVEGGIIDNDKPRVKEKKTTSRDLVNRLATNSSNNPEFVAERSIEVAATVGACNFSKEPATDSKDGGYNTKTIVNGIEYKDYKQGNYSDTQNYTVSGSGPISSHGCSVTSSAILLSGYGIDKTPVELAEQMGWQLGSNSRVAEVCLTGNGVEAEWFDTSGDDACKKITEAVEAGKPVIALMGPGGNPSWTAGGHFVTIVGIKEDGTVLVSDPGTVRSERNEECPEQLSEMCNYMKGIAIPKEAPTGAKISSTGYKGYNGNEAVVSPVTGILLEYGTYDGEKDSISNQEYRENVDYKYVKDEKNAGEGDNQQNSSDNSTENSATSIPHDHVGYAKILVLDKKAYTQLEKQFNSDIEGINDGKSTLVENNNFTDDALSKEKQLDDWTDKQKTIYGYKEFAENYEKAGIAGHILYIDGFKCEYPDEKTSLDYNNEEQSEIEYISHDTTSTDSSTTNSNSGNDFIPDGEDISIDTFKKITDGNFTDGNISNSEELLKSLYEKEDEYKMASKSATKKLNAESEVKNQAISSFYTGDSIKIQLTEDGKQTEYDGIFIKEGTVIGRTMTDKELIDDIREGKFGSYEELRGSNASEEKRKQLIGNYLRVIMLDKNRDQVEDVENYMKLDGPEDKTTSVSLEQAIKELEAITKDSSAYDKIKALIDYYVAQGFPPEVGAGIAGNSIQECSLDQTYNDGEYHGLFNINGGRWESTVKWMKEQGYDENSFAGQVRAPYENYEAEGRFKDSGKDPEGLWEELKSVKSEVKAGEFWCVYYEGCVGGDTSKGSSGTRWYDWPSQPIGSIYQQLTWRENFSKNALKIYNGDKELDMKANPDAPIDYSSIK